MNSAIISSETSPENERAASKGEVDITPKLDYDNKAGETDMYNSTSSSGHIDTSVCLPNSENTTPVSIENKSNEGGEKEDEEDGFEDIEDDSEPVSEGEIEGGEPRGRLANPVAGLKPRTK